MKKSLSCLLFSCLLCSSVHGQALEITTRYDYYFASDTTATLLLLAAPEAEIETLAVGGLTAERLSNYGDVARFRIDTRRFGVGNHSLPVRADLVGGATLGLELHLRKLPRKPGAVRVDRLTGGLLVDELPFFPFGFYAGYPVGDLPMQEIYNAMNLIGVYQSNEQETLEGRKAYMDLCASIGMKVNYAVNGLVGTPHNRSDAIISQAEEERRWALLRNEVETFKDHPALLSWYMNDEPVGQSRSPELLEKAYQIIKEIDPYHPVSVVFVIPGRSAPFMNTFDIAMTDPYPIPGDVDAVRAHMRSLTDNFRFRKALWLVPQAFGGGEFWRREPTGPEIHAMTWLGIQEGAMGIQYFIRRHPNLFPKSRIAWNEAVRAAHEVSMIQPWLFTDSPRQELATGSDRIRAVALNRDESSLILVTNPDTTPVSFNIDVSDLASSELARSRLPFDNRSVDITGNSLSETIGPLETRAYLLEAATTTDPHNAFPNPGFEWVTSPGVPAGAYANSDHRPLYDGSTYFIDSRVSHTGHNSIRLHAVSDTSHLRLTFYRMYLQQDRTYHVSMWSRHAHHSLPVQFAVSLPQLDLSREFSTTEEWKSHAYYFNVGDAPFVQLAIETAGKGTVWFDDVVVVPDPIVDVTVRDGPRATVRLHSVDPSTSLSYRLNGGQEYKYSGPIGVASYSRIDLLVSRKDMPDERVSLTVPLSLATRRECSFKTRFSDKYSGSGAGTVVDGEYGSLSFRDGRYLGFDGKDVEFTVDLAQTTSVGSVMVHFLVSPDDGIHAPNSIQVWTGPDRSAWSLLGEVKNHEGTLHGDPYHLALDVSGAPRETRYVRVKVNSPITIPDGYLFSGTDAWIFIDETLVRAPQ